MTGHRKARGPIYDDIDIIALLFFAIFAPTSSSRAHNSVSDNNNNNNNAYVHNTYRAVCRLHTKGAMSVSLVVLPPSFLAYRLSPKGWGRIRIWMWISSLLQIQLT